MTDLAKNIETLLSTAQPIVYRGQDVVGNFLFTEGYDPRPTHSFQTLTVAIEQLHGRFKPKTDSISSAPHHAGFNDGLMGKVYLPRTKVSDGQPRELSYAEQDAYTEGYIEGLMAAKAADDTVVKV